MSSSDSTPAPIVAVLQEAFPVESELLGDEVVEDIAAGHAFGRAEGGSSIDLGTTMAALTVAAQFAVAALELYTLLKKNDKEAPTCAVFESTVEERVETSLDSVQRTRVTRICHRIYSRQ